MSGIEWFLVAILVLPALAGGYVALSGQARGVMFADRMHHGVRVYAQSMESSSGSVVRFVKQPVARLFVWFGDLTEGVCNEAHRAGMRIAGGGYIAIGLIGLALLLAALATTLLLLIAFALMASARGNGKVVGKSVLREGWFGRKYTEHQDASGNVIGESEERPGFFGGRYTEHRDAEGHVTGHSRSKTGFFGGDYVEHTDAAGRVTGESRDREGMFGDEFTEHRNAAGEVVGETRRREGLLGGRYEEHRAT